MAHEYRGPTSGDGNSFPPQQTAFPLAFAAGSQTRNLDCSCAKPHPINSYQSLPDPSCPLHGLPPTNPEPFTMHDNPMDPTTAAGSCFSAEQNLFPDLSAVDDQVPKHNYSPEEPQNAIYSRSCSDHGLSNGYTYPSPTSRDPWSPIPISQGPLTGPGVQRQMTGLDFRSCSSGGTTSSPEAMAGSEYHANQSGAYFPPEFGTPTSQGNVTGSGHPLHLFSNGFAEPSFPPRPINHDRQLVRSPPTFGENAFPGAPESIENSTGVLGRVSIDFGTLDLFFEFHGMKPWWDSQNPALRPDESHANTTSLCISCPWSGCHKKFTYKLGPGNLIRHLKSVHKGQTVNCMRCDRTFCRGDAALHHMRTVHQMQIPSRRQSRRR
jgi:hypothetical protein